MASTICRSLRAASSERERRVSYNHLLAAIVSADAGMMPALLPELGTTGTEPHRLAQTASSK